MWSYCGSYINHWVFWILYLIWAKKLFWMWSSFWVSSLVLVFHLDQFEDKGYVWNCEEVFLYNWYKNIIVKFAMVFLQLRLENVLMIILDNVYSFGKRFENKNFSMLGISWLANNIFGKHREKISKVRQWTFIALCASVFACVHAYLHIQC